MNIYNSMKPLFTEADFKNAMSCDKLPCECASCDSVFYTTKRNIMSYINPNDKMKGDFCSLKCYGNYRKQIIEVECSNCGKKIYKTIYNSKKSKSGNLFCSTSCSAKYNNTHKTNGYRRSKLEIYIEDQLTIMYPNMSIDYNKTDAINSELDIFIPSLKLAFELNGIFHYEPIYGEVKLGQIQNNDNRKFQACIEREIELCIIDSSGLKRFKKERGEEYLNIIVNIISNKLK